MGQIRPHLIDEDWSGSLWKTFIVMTMGTQIPVITEKSLTVSGWRKFQLDTMGDHLCTCTPHSGVKQVMTAKNRGRHCGDIEMTVYLPNTEDRVLDLHITHDRFGSSSDRSLNGHLHYPNVRVGYTPPPCPHLRSSFSHELRSFGFWRVRPDLVSPSPRPIGYPICFTHTTQCMWENTVCRIDFPLDQGERVKGDFITSCWWDVFDGSDESWV